MTAYAINSKQHLSFFKIYIKAKNINPLPFPIFVIENFKEQEKKVFKNFVRFLN